MDAIDVEPEDLVYNTLYKYTRALSLALGYRDSMTRLHSERVRGLAEEIGIGCALSSKELGILKISASFHDIGKIGIPDPILSKPSSFDEAEWGVMKQHAEMGAQIMAATDLEGSQQAALAIRHHHEHYDGTGYPDGLAGEAIHIAARIISIADSYDAMAVTRSYHRAATHEKIMAVLARETGKKHDPELMRIFCRIIPASKFRAVDDGSGDS